MSHSDKYIDNDGQYGENIEFDIATAASDVTIYVIGTGTETETAKYLNKGSMGKGFVLRPDKNVSIVSIGNKTYRNPIPVSTAGWVQKTHIPDFSQIVIRVPNANTHINLFVM